MKSFTATVRKNTAIFTQENLHRMCSLEACVRTHLHVKLSEANLTNLTWRHSYNSMSHVYRTSPDSTACNKNKIKTKQSKTTTKKDWKCVEDLHFSSEANQSVKRSHVVIVQVHHLLYQFTHSLVSVHSQTGSSVNLDNHLFFSLNVEEGSSSYYDYSTARFCWDELCTLKPINLFFHCTCITVIPEFLGAM